LKVGVLNDHSGAKEQAPGPTDVDCRPCIFYVSHGGKRCTHFSPTKFIINERSA